ncbi:Ypt/Rab-GAP domain of gyp1p superfamily protein [Zea mays]|uniref:Ypt/Rab-GAP domain of gyp1p superfamily protein n=2 Tax=Zea mays TaxID=4577 RepID=A0A1D6KN83_MAIZE|nr:Ypt/Rab-GAP domain of gyp1p superfamily protein [Zea mays]
MRGGAMKALRRSSTSSAPSPRVPSSPRSYSWIHRRSLLVTSPASPATSSVSESANLPAEGSDSAPASVVAASSSPSLAASSPNMEWWGYPVRISPRAAWVASKWGIIVGYLIFPNNDSRTYSQNYAVLVAQWKWGGIKSPWSRRKRKRALTCQHWNRLFSANGKLRDGGRKFLKKVRSGGIEPGIRAEVWPFLLGVYDLNSSEEDRNTIKIKKRKEYEKLRRQCHRILHCNRENGLNVINEFMNEDFSDGAEGSESPYSNGVSKRVCVMPKELKSLGSKAEESESSNWDAVKCIDEDITSVDPCLVESESSESESSYEEDPDRTPVSTNMEENCGPKPKFARTASSKSEIIISDRTPEDFATWQRIIRVDAIRANTEWVLFARNQAEVSKEKALQSAISVGLKDFDHLEPYMIYHAARLVALLEAYALYDPEIGYCQGMSDLLSPIIAVMEEDHEAFWCFVGFMRKARHNFRLDEVGIKRQLKTVSQIIKRKDSHLYRHLQKLQAEDCFFLYRMVVVLFRRELTFEQTMCLWEVMWADQAAIRAGIGRSTWARIRLHAPPTDDLLLYAIAACVLQKRKLIIEKYSSMDEILRECNSMAGQLDVWKLLDDAHHLVVDLHDKI